MGSRNTSARLRPGPGVLAALAYPLFMLCFLVIFLRSVALTPLRRPVWWKGRRVASRATG